MMQPKPFAALLAVTLLATPALSEMPADGAGLSGLYAGSYLCQDGEHGVVLDLTLEPRRNGGEFRIDGRLGFVPVLAGAQGEFGSVAGSFTVVGAVAADGRMTLRHQLWLVEPEGYGAANFNGRLSQRADGLWQITGTPLAGPTSEFCSDLIATQFLANG